MLCLLYKTTDSSYFIYYYLWVSNYEDQILLQFQRSAEQLYPVKLPNCHHLSELGSGGVGDIHFQDKTFTNRFKTVLLLQCKFIIIIGLKQSIKGLDNYKAVEK